MRSINRASVKNPIDDNNANILLRELEAKVAQMPNGYEMQFRPSFNMNIWKNKIVKSALFKLFHGKCAFCETNLVGGYDINHFWPKSIYWKRVYDWENLFLSCPTCNRSKAGRFPLDPYSGKPELLNPCEDNIDFELTCLDNGQLKALSQRAENTIKIFGLNRVELVEARYVEYERTASLMHRVTSLANWEYLISKFISLESVPNEYSDLFNELIFEMEEKQQYTLAKKAAYKAVIENTSKAKINQNNFKSDIKMYDWIKQIRIINFKSIQNLTINFNNESSNQFWMAIIGENGVGKSSILQAIALIFMSDQQRKEYAKDASSYVNKNAQKGEIQVYFTNTDSSVKLKFSKLNHNFIEVIYGRETMPEIPILGYSAVRMPPPNHTMVVPSNTVSLENLFNPWRYLPSTESWLADSNSVEDELFQNIAKILKNILQLDDLSYFIRRDQLIFLKNNTVEIQLKELSDGYKSLFAIATNIIYNWQSNINDINSLHGIVLIDELEVHLHPKWKLKIITSLREAFPNINFIVTTHDPLCLRGLNNNEIIHIKNNKGNIEMDYLNIPNGLNVEQILTGAWFDMDSTYDIDTISLYSKYQESLNKVNNSEEIKSIEYELADKLNIYVENSIERMAQSVAAQIMREEYKRMEESNSRLSKVNLREKIYLQAKQRLEKS